MVIYNKFNYYYIIKLNKINNLNIDQILINFLLQLLNI